MKNLKGLLISCCILAALCGCEPGKRDIDPVDETIPGLEEPAVFPAGTPAGPEMQFTVTPEGGTFKSADGSVKLVFPAGAVSSAKQFSMQPVENTAPAGSGKSVRLLPHGTQFAKPVTIQLSYSGMEDEIASTASLFIAWQDEKGHWLFMPEPVVDPVAKTVSVETTHFSDWVIAQTARLSPARTSIKAGDDLTLRVMRYIQIDELLAPLVKDSPLYMIEGQPLHTRYIRNGGQSEAWQLGGTGELESSGNKAVFYAPDYMLEPAVANVMVELHNKRDPQARHFLVSTIHIGTGAGVSYRINGGAWRHLPNALVTELKPNQFGLSSIVDPTRLNISWAGGIGTHRWNGKDDIVPDYITDAGIINIQSNIFSHAFYETPDGFVTSSGSVTVSVLDKKKNNVEGTFIIYKAGVFNGKGEQIRTEKIEGRFAAKYLSIDNLPNN